MHAWWKNRLSHSNIYGVLPVEKINGEMRSAEKNCFAAEITVFPSKEL